MIKGQDFYFRAAKQEYSEKSARYSEKDKEKWASGNFTAQNLSEVVRAFRPSRVLELGVGTGRYFPYVTGASFTGVDISPEMLSHAKERIPILREQGFAEVSLVAGELGEFLAAQSNEQFDFVFSIGCIGYHVEVTPELFSQISRVMKPNSQLFLQTTQQSFGYKLGTVIKRWKNLALRRSDNSRFFVSTTKNHLRKYSKKAGLESLWVREDTKVWYDRPLMLSLYKKMT